VDYSVEIRIFDRRGGKAFEWRAGQGNLILGFLVTTEFVEQKIGIDLRDYLALLSGGRQPASSSSYGAAPSLEEDRAAICEH
jgi:hypothetical protein